MPGTPVAAATAAPGFYGKAVTHGDFLSRNLPNAFVDAWDGWLRRGLAASKTALGEDWLPHYLSAPIWRFALSANVCGAVPAAGILMPSVDSVGRHFPMTLARLLKDKTISPAELFAHGQDWFCQCEDAALTCLEESFDVETFHARLQTLPDLGEVKANAKSGFSIEEGKGLGVKLSAPNAKPDWNALSLSAWDALAKKQFGNYSLWWSTGTDSIPPAILTFSGLPRERTFAEFLCDNE